MKKRMLIALITIIPLLFFGALCFAGSDYARTVANTSKRGSLLVFPLVRVGPAEYQDTIITITNDYSTAVHIQCMYSTPENCACDGNNFTLTPYHSVAFSAKTRVAPDNEFFYDEKHRVIGMPAFPWDNQTVTDATLRCWAVDDVAPYRPISYNYLSGSAIIGEDTNQSWQYSAWRFAVGYAIKTNTPVPSAGSSAPFQLRLTGLPRTYDACPGKLLFNFIEQAPDPTANQYPEGARKGYRTVDNRLTLVPCKQDCVSSDNESIVRVTLGVRDEYENSGGTYACFDCDDNTTAFYHKSLSGKSPLTTQIEDPNTFRGYPLGDIWTPGGYIEVSTALNGDNNCSGIGKTAVRGIPVLGVMAHRFSSPDGPIAGDTPTVIAPPQAYLTDISGNNMEEVVIRYSPK